ncbi:MAG: sigma-70 family RNA polymerase sigma factor [Candidatus Rokubacteria bacterium]|nr:sigma-70 family RNA polymerase sigma factor [Candidatus Rokubacteria bacterium]
MTWEVVETVWEKIATFRGDSALSSWIYRIAVNAAYAKLRGRSRTLPFDDARSHPDHVDEPGHQGGTSHDWSALLEDPAVQAELREVLERGLAELSAEYRTVLVLRDVEGLSNAEVAEIFGLAAVKSRVHRARLALRARLAQHFEKGSAA